jgi:glycosyltransferase involved in cell wall biosynthesis
VRCIFRPAGLPRPALHFSTGVHNCDEIWRPEKKLTLVDACKAARFQQQLHYYFLNLRRVGPPWRRGTVRTRFKDFVDAQSLRMDAGAKQIEDGGWHFSYVGDAKKIVAKLKSFSHTEYSSGHWTDAARIEALVRSGRDLFDRDVEFATIDVDESFPRPLLETPGRWAPLIRVIPQSDAGVAVGPALTGEGAISGKRAAAGGPRTAWSVADAWRSGIARVGARISRLDVRSTQEELGRRMHRLVASVKWSGRTWLQRLGRDEATSSGYSVACPSVQPLVSVLFVVRNDSPSALRRSVESVLRQSTPQWEMRIIVDPVAYPGTMPRLARWRQRDQRVHIVQRSWSDVADAHQAALEGAAGEFVLPLHHGDELSPDAVASFAQAAREQPALDMLYADEDVVGRFSVPLQPFLKPDWSPHLLSSHDYVGQPLALRTALVLEVGGFRAGFAEAFQYDLLLRGIERVATGGITHLPRILYHRRRSGSSPPSPPQAGSVDWAAARIALEQHVVRSQPGATVACVAGVPSLFRVIQPLPSPCRVTVIVTARDKLELVRTCVRGLLEYVGSVTLDVVVVDNGSVEPATLHSLDDLAGRQGVRVLRIDEPFNFSRLCNRAAAIATGETLCFLNNDVDPGDGLWIEELAALASLPDVGAVGPLLRHPDGRLQHLGICVDEPMPRLIGDGARDSDLIDCVPRHVVRDVRAVSGDCLVTRREVFERIGGFDERLAVACNDVDFCLRLRAAGLRVVWTPFAELTRVPLATRGRVRTADDRARWGSEYASFEDRWGDALEVDPFWPRLP